MARSIPAVSCSNVASYASGRTRMTISADNSAGSICRRASSRRRRFKRFRATAECLNRGTIRPTRKPPYAELSKRARGEAAARTSKCWVRMRFPSRAMRCSSPPRVIRAWRGKLNDASGVLRAGILVRDTDRELLTSLLPTAGQSCTTPPRFHACTKSVRLQPSRVARAVGWLSHNCSKYGLR